jgi:hypothetical protein
MKTWTALDWFCTTMAFFQRAARVQKFGSQTLVKFLVGICALMQKADRHRSAISKTSTRRLIAAWASAGDLSRD